MSLHAVLFYLLAAITAISAVAVVLTQNIVRAAAWLLFALAGTSGIFFLLGADFIGATQLLIYVGGTLVLVVFGVMLTAQGPFVNMRIGPAEWAIAASVSLLLFGVLAVSLLGVAPPARHTISTEIFKSAKGARAPASESPDSDGGRTLTPSIDLGAVLLGDRRAIPDGIIPGVPIVRERSKMSYLLPFEIVSVHLLVVLIGAAYLARAKKRVKPSELSDVAPKSIRFEEPVVAATEPSLSSSITGAEAHD